MNKIKNKDIGDKIQIKNASWSFGKKVPKNFTKHIKKSVPFYSEGHEIILQLSDFFLKKKSYCYDLGCSTGTLINKISSRHPDKQIKFCGIDSIKNMILQAKKENKIIKNKNKIYYVNGNIEKKKIKKSDLIQQLIF